MATNLELITDALREINVINEVQTPTGEQGEQSLRKLNRMMEMWKDDDIDVGWFAQSDTTDTAPVPDWAEMAVVLALSVRLAPQYGATLSSETVAALNSALNIVRRKSIKEKMDNADMSHMPIGQGHFDSRYDIQNDT